MSFSPKWAAGLVAALLLGIVFRLAWPDDIEYKMDEFYTFAKTRSLLTGAPLPGDTGSPWLGMPTSKGFQNTAMSLWVFYPLALLPGADTPPGLARGVQLCNIAAILLLLAFVLRCLKDREREWWLWAIALVCVNPFAVLFERKIWPPCTLPLMMVVFLICWRSRPTRLGAFFWGLLGILAAQIHMAGFFYAGAFFLWTLAYDRRRAAWLWWGAGTFLGAIPMAPWLIYMAHYMAGTGAQAAQGAQTSHAAFMVWKRPFTNHFWVQWISEPFGLGLDYSLGWTDFFNFLRHPFIGSHATYGVALLQVAALFLAVCILGAGFRHWWQNRARWRENWKNDHATFTPAVLQAGFWFYGILLTISFLRFERHYLIVAFPLVLLWAAKIALPADATDKRWSAGRRLLLALCVVNALVSFLFLDFIHTNGGAPQGDYGVPYGSSENAFRNAVIPPPKTTLE
ncbi:MAG TPA: hypothetical protein VG733_08985 [Chthoniobacteraceae bacterium]|nr:hypothetical protein [Chthoniobacteraceae bacterium]